MSQLFNKIKVAGNRRSTFDLSHHQVTTSDFGYLIPICYRDMVPNDDFVVSPNIFCRLSPLAVPTYGKITCRVHHFFVPYRLLYGKWNSFITQDSNNSTVPPYLTQSVVSQAVASDSWMDRTITTGYRGKYCRIMSNLGLNPNSIKYLPSTDKINMFPFLAYYRIWLDYFCDPSLNNHPALVEAFNQLVANGGNLYNASTTAPDICFNPRYTCYKKDYFTTARLNPQDGSRPSIVPVDLADSTLNPGLHGATTTVSIQSNGSKIFQNGFVTGATDKVGQFTIEALRAADSLQRYLERNNFVGSKIINRILAHFGVAPTAERLDMAEFLGGDSFPIQIGDVTSTSISSGYDDNGDGLDMSIDGLGLQAGKGVGASQSKTVRYHASEHGVFMSLMSILPDTSYYQGVSRFWTKGTDGDALDFFTPEFENLGYQEILNKEVYVREPNDLSYTNYNGNTVFGYSPRYSEYKFQNDVLGGEFTAVAPSGLSQLTQSTDSWHLFRELAYSNTNPLALNNNFVELNPHNNSFDRIFQYTDNTFDHFYFNIDVDVKATRPMAGFAEPSIDSVNAGDGNSIELPYGGTRL